MAAFGIQLTLKTAAGCLSARETTRIVHAAAKRDHAPHSSLEAKRDCQGAMNT